MNSEGSTNSTLAASTTTKKATHENEYNSFSSKIEKNDEFAVENDIFPTGTGNNETYLNRSSDLSDWSERRRLKKEINRREEGKHMYDRLDYSHAMSQTAYVDKREKYRNWLLSLKELDPRIQILTYFDEIARVGGPLSDPLAKPTSIELLRGFSKGATFTVWRPTSTDAIAKMVRGDAIGKGLDIKGKSAKTGKLSGFVPFLQIHNNNHKKNVDWPPSNSWARVYFKTIELRNVANIALNASASEMEMKFKSACDVLNDPSRDPKMEEKAYEDKRCHVEDPIIREVNVGEAFGLDIPQRVFFETFINAQDICRKGTEYETARPSEPAFQGMNFTCVGKEHKEGSPKAVILQTCDLNALCPHSIVLAYEENGKVRSVVSDFDCFTIGTRGVHYDQPLPSDQVEMMKHVVAATELLLETPNEKSWTSRWLDVLKEYEVKKKSRAPMPEYGYGDKVSYSILEGAVARFVNKNKNGAIRHGAECFNYYFPQEIDDHFLVVSDALPGKVRFKYVSNSELIDLICERIDDGFCFPLNPKWIIADKGWKRVYDKMLHTNLPSVQRALDSWYPRNSGIREQFEAIHVRFPNGFERINEEGRSAETQDEEGMDAMNLASDELRRYLILRRAKLKLRTTLLIARLGKNKGMEPNSSEVEETKTSMQFNSSFEEENLETKQNKESKKFEEENLETKQNKEPKKFEEENVETKENKEPMKKSMSKFGRFIKTCAKKLNFNKKLLKVSEH